MTSSNRPACATRDSSTLVPLLLLLLSWSPGCADDTRAGSEEPDDTDGTDNPDGGCRSMDILFVIDDSGTMWEEQENLISNFPLFIDVLDGYNADYRIGITTTSVNRTFKAQVPGLGLIDMDTEGPDGVLVGQGDCDLPAPWMSSVGQGIEEEFSCAARVGTGGATTEMPFAAIELALGIHSQDGGPNEGFYRAGTDSLLVIVLITDEDDCSISSGGQLIVSSNGGADCSTDTSTGLYTIQRTKNFLDDITNGPKRYLLISMAGKSECTTSFGAAIEAKRISQLVGQVENGYSGDICNGDLWSNLEEAVDMMGIVCEEMPVVE